VLSTIITKRKSAMTHIATSAAKRKKTMNITASKNAAMTTATIAPAKNAATNSITIAAKSAAAARIAFVKNSIQALL
jgi:hypothetical protein